MDNREKILAHALQRFADRGYDAVGVQEIAAAAGVAKPTLYHYFGSKIGLLEALFAAYFDPLNQRVSLAAAYHGDLPLTLTRLVECYFQYARENPTFYRLQLGLWLAPRQSEAHLAVARWSAPQTRSIEAMFRAAARDHGNMIGREQAYAATLTGMIHTYISLSLNGYCELNAALVHQAVHQFQHGIYS